MTFMKLLCNLDTHTKIVAISLEDDACPAVIDCITRDLEDDDLLKYGCWNIVQLSPEKDKEGYPYLQVLLEETCFKTICTLDSDEKKREEQENENSY